VFCVRSSTAPRHSEAATRSVRIANEMKWVCCQLGAREHYAIPRALFRIGMFGCLVTDAWVPPSSLLAKCCGHSSKFRHRFHSELRDARVKAFNSSLLIFEMLARGRDSKGWPKILGRNRWFQRKILSFLRSQVSSINSVKERGSHGALRSRPTTLNRLRAPNFLPHASAL